VDGGGVRLTDDVIAYCATAVVEVSTCYVAEYFSTSFSSQYCHCQSETKLYHIITTAGRAPRGAPTVGHVSLCDGGAISHIIIVRALGSLCDNDTLIGLISTSVSGFVQVMSSSGSIFKFTRVKISVCTEATAITVTGVSTGIRNIQITAVSSVTGVFSGVRNIHITAVGLSDIRQSGIWPRPETLHCRVIVNVATIDVSGRANYEGICQWVLDEDWRGALLLGTTQHHCNEKWQ
jgi:hypothetical protein